MNIKKNIRILLVDDDPQLRKFLRISLSLYGFEIVEAETGRQGISMASTENPDLIILDVELPDIKGNDVVSNVREWSKVPIIILTSKNDESDKVEALDKKADEFVTKPFDFSELMQKIERMIKVNLKNDEVDQTIKFGGVRVDLSGGKILSDEKPADLLKIEHNEFLVLKTLVGGQGKVVTFKQLLREISEEDEINGMIVLRKIIDKLRRAIEKNPEFPEFIILEPKIGYRFMSANS